MFYTKILSSIYLLAFSTTVLSTPAPSVPGDSSAFFDNINVISRRANLPLPSIQDIKDHLNVPKDVSLFYSGPGSYAKQALDWAKKNNSGYKILSQLWTDPNYQNKWQKDEDTSTKFFNLASQAMAELSSGIVYVMLPSDTKGTDWKKDTVWAEYEWPNLGSAVKEVVRVNPENDDQETIKGGSSTAGLYVPGWCGLHVTQYQKHEPKSNPTGDYKLDITIKDATGAIIGGTTGAVAKAGVGVGIDSRLPFVLTVTAQNVDNDPLLFKYADQSWGSNDQAHHCNFGAYDGGNRDGDCGFNC